MKKIIVILLTLAMLISFAACSGKTEEPKPETEKIASEEQPAEPEPQPVVEPTAPQQEEPVPEEKTEEPEEPEEPAEPEQPEPEPEPVFLSPITGLACTEEQYNMRPYGMMFNYAMQGVARVQTGLCKADLMVESYTEPYTSRIMAVFQDISGAGQLGPLRSARILYAELAHAYNLNFVHVGSDPKYCGPYMTRQGMKTLNFNVYYQDKDGTPFWFREPNGLSNEHTLYTTDDAVKLCADYRGVAQTTEDHEPWFTFTTEEENPALASGEACSVFSVTMNRYHDSVFHYDAESGLYSRWWNDELVIDYKTSEPVLVKNVLCLNTKVGYRDDGTHANVSLVGGEGWYTAEGKVIPIHWTTNDAGRFVLTDSENNVIPLDAGKTWICLHAETFGVSWE